MLNLINSEFEIKFAKAKDIPIILNFIKDLAKYEKLENEVVATEQSLHDTLFGKKTFAEVLIASESGVEVGFALFFHNYSTFLGKPGIYLEDLFVKEEFRGKGYGKALLTKLAKITVERNCGRLEWSVLDWNEPSIKFYKKLGAVPMEGWTVFRVDKDSLLNLAK
ncbi:MAG: GNAT family N-acetyltransferase [Calditrichaeota bacterium]|nr:MAG: GNAT family N-acetyltransferase [Calditrichota bacterium]